MKDKKRKLILKNRVKKSYKICSLVLAFLTSAFLWYWNISPYWDEGYFSYVTLSVIGIMFCVVYWFFVKMYEAQKIGLYRLTDLTYFQLLSYFFADVILCVEMIFWFRGLERIHFRRFILIFIIQMFVITLMIFVHNRIFMRYDEPRKVMIVYGKESYRLLEKKIKAKKRRYKIIGCYKDDVPFEVLKKKIRESDNIYLYEVNDELRRQFVFYCEMIGKEIYLTQNVEDLITMSYDVSHTFDTPFARTKRVPVKWYYPFVKRTMDIVFSGIACIVLSPLFLVVAIAIKLYDGGPVFYTQERVTEGRRKFMIYKFRSMITDAEAHGMRRATDQDDRITPVGKIIRATRIDELPQLLNIIKGDMSIVGPRPERVELDDIYTKQLPEFTLRLKVKAGLTGYAQIFGKYNTTPEDKLKLDLLYISQRSLHMDFMLIFYTIKIMFIPESTEGFEEDETTLEDIKKK